MRTTTILLMVMLLTGCGSYESNQNQTGAQPTWKAGVADNAADIQPAPVGATAPSAKLPSPTGVPVDLSQAYSAGPTMLIFYRGGWCPYCTRQLADLATVMPEIEQLGVQVMAISPDDPEHLKKTLTATDLGYTLLSDSDMALSKAFGLAFKLDDETLTKYDEYGINLVAASGGQTHNLLPVPAVYLVDQQGVIRFVHWDANYKQRLDASDVVAAAAKMILK